MNELLHATGIAFGVPERLTLVPVALGLIIVLGYLSLRKIRKERRHTFITGHVLKGDLPHLGVLIIAECAIAFAALAFAIAFAEPVMVKKVSEERRGGIRIAYLVDISLSMDARDVKDGTEETSRIAMVKKFLGNTEELFTMKNGNTLPQSVIPFAGEANLYGLFTESSTQIHELFSVISTQGLITTQGSDFVYALGVYRDLLDHDPLPAGMNDIVVILSDGGNDPGGKSNDVGTLASDLAKLSGRTTVITIGVGGDTPVEIPAMLPDGSWKDVLRKEPDQEPAAPEQEPWGGEGRSGGTPPPKTAPSASDKEPWLTAFDEEMMLMLSGNDGKCIRLVNGPTVKTTPEPPGPRKAATGCVRTTNLDELTAEFANAVRAKMRPLPPVVHEERTNIESYFLWFGLAMLFIAILCERHKAIARKRADKGMREVLFGSSDDEEE